MKIRLRNTLALVFATVMTFSMLCFTSYAAEPDEFDDAPVITEETFNVTILNSYHKMYYKYEPQNTGYYFFPSRASVTRGSRFLTKILTKLDIHISATGLTNRGFYFISPAENLITSGFLRKMKAIPLNSKSIFAISERLTAPNS